MAQVTEAGQRMPEDWKGLLGSHGVKTLSL